MVQLLARAGIAVERNFARQHGRDLGQAIPGCGQGLLVARACRQRHTPRGLVQNVSRGKQRAAMTHAALLCDDPAAQRALPQLLIAGEASMTAAQEREVRAILPAHTMLIRQKKGWINTDIMCWLAQQVQVSLRAWQDTHTIIFMVGAYRSHL